jgi:hypothetical protein
MKIKGLLLAAIIAAIMCVSGNVLAVLSGSGTESNPYLIQSRAAFDEFANPANAATYWVSGKYTRLMRDIDLAGTSYTQAVIAPDTSTNQGFQGIAYSGIFDGNGHTISNLTVTASSKDYVGLFGTIGSGGQVKNLGVINVAILGHDYVSGLVGINSGTMISCHIRGTVSGALTIGGLVGGNHGTISSCSSSGLVSNTNMFVGGLCGQNFITGVIIGSCSASDVTGETDAGGLCGFNVGTISDGYATGNVTGESCVGGLCGYNYHDDATISSSYAVGSVTGYNYVGGLCGQNRGTISGSFWDVETSGIADPEEGVPDTNGIIGLPTAKMQTQSTFTGWDFSTPVWKMLRENEDYPRLAWQAIYPGDIAGLYGVDMEDLNMLIEYWLGTWHVKADIVDDSIVNLMDLSVIGQNWMLTECGDCNGADITGDGNVDTQDVAILADQWLFQENPDCQQADIDNSGTVDLADLSILAANWMDGG